MSLNDQQIHKIADLAMLSIDQSELPTIKKDLNNILALVEQMQQVDTNNVTPMEHPLNAEQHLRVDQATEPEQRELLQNLAPAVENGLYLVPLVIE